MAMRKKTRILVAASDMGTLRTLTSSLRQIGYSTIVATSLQEAGAHAARNKPDAAIIEAGLLAGHRDASHVRLGIPVMLMSDGSHAIPVRMLSVCQGFVEKPFTTRSLRTSVELAIARAGVGANQWKNHGWYKSIMSLMGDAVIVTDERGKIAVLNGGAKTLTGWEPAKAEKCELSQILKLLDADTRKPVKSTMSALLHDFPEGLNAEHMVLIDKGGREHHVEISTNPVSDTKGRNLGMVLVLYDLAERTMVTRRMLAIQKARAIGVLTRGLAQDFSTTMHVISGYAASMADSLLPETRVHEDALRISETSRHAADLASRLLNLTQAGETPELEKPGPVCVLDAVKTAAGLFQSVFDSQKIHFSVKTPDEMPGARANRGQLLDVLVCLLLNAAEAMPDGGTATIQIASKQIASPDRKMNPDAKSGHYAVISVTDTGAGIPSGVIDNIFNPFFSTKQAGEARGLGLTVVRQMVLSWGGWVTVRSKAGHGASFRIFIPASRVKRAKQEPVRTAGHSVLVLDDSETDLDFISKTLEEAGYKAYQAQTLDQALDFCSTLNDKLELALIDLVMPQTDGKQAFEAITNASPGISAIMMSGFSRDYVRGCIGAGGWGFVQKPVEKDQLLKAVIRAFQKDSDPSAVSSLGTRSE